MSKADRERIINPFHYRRGTTTFQPDCRLSYETDYSFGWGMNGWFGWSAFLSNVSGSGGNTFYPPSKDRATSAEAKALSRLQSKCRRNSVNLAQAYAERKQAVDMISKRLGQLAHIVLFVKRGNFQAAGRVLREAVGSEVSGKTFKERSRKRAREHSAAVLEIQYGLRPLLSDIYGSCELIARTYYEKRPLYVVGSAHDTLPIKENGSVLFVDGNYKCQIEWTGQIEERCRYVIHIAEDDTMMTVLADTGLTNPALLAWELLPWSFVADWVIPVGAYLEQLEYARGLSFVRGSKTVVREMNASARGRLVGSATPHSRNGVCQVGFTATDFSIKRTVLAGFPYARFPSFSPKLGVERGLNAIALITQAFTGGKPHGRLR